MLDRNEIRKISLLEGIMKSDCEEAVYEASVEFLLNEGKHYTATLIAKQNESYSSYVSIELVYDFSALDDSNPLKSLGLTVLGNKSIHGNETVDSAIESFNDVISTLRNIVLASLKKTCVNN